MEVPARPLREIAEQGIRLLVREMGAADAARFIRQFTTGYGDYTRQRKELFKDLTPEELLEGIRALAGLEIDSIR
jgi:hypothetical protein